jgi:hypothetical protein
MKAMLLLLLAVVLFGLTGCGTKDADYYISHPEEFKKKVEECKVMPHAEKMADKECAAVNIAISKKFFGSGMEKPGDGKGKELPKLGE